MGIDLGTTGCKVILYDTNKKNIYRSYEEYSLDAPRAGWVEQDPQYWWDATKKSVKSILFSSKVHPADIKAIGLCGQMHTHVLLDKAGRPLRPAMSWMDQRSGSQVEGLKRKIGIEFIFDQTANFPTTTYTLPQILWVRENEPEIFARISKVLVAKDYIKFRLTSEMTTDPSEASGTLLFDVAHRRWSEELLHEVGLSGDILPQLTSSTDIVGKITQTTAIKTGLISGIPVISGGGDCATEAVGAGIIEEGQMVTVIGTAGVVYICSHTPRSDARFRALCWYHAVEDKWITIAVMQSTGYALRWFRDNFGREEKDLAESQKEDVYKILGKKAATVPAGCEGLIFLPYLMGERSPHWDSDARGVFFGFSIHHTKAHFIRSIMEGVAYAIRENAEVIQNLGVKTKEVRALGGGNKSKLWRQLQADVMGRRILKVFPEEGAAWGAVILAGVGVGLYDSVAQAIKEMVKVIPENEPDEIRHRGYNDWYKVYRQLYQRLAPVYKTSAEILRKEG
jgi:xylulokinase